MADERSREELIAENARLRRQILHRRSNSPMWPVIGGLLLHIALRPFLDPWLNGTSDSKVDLAVVILAAPLLLSVVTLFRALRFKPD